MSEARLEGRTWKLLSGASATNDAGSEAEDCNSTLAAAELGPNVQVATRLSRDEAIDAIVARGSAMQDIVRKIGNAARSHASLLVTGEVGSGKRAIARLVHELSPRVDMPFVRVDCAAIPPTDLEAELVGFKRFAFEGASRDREGLLQAAHRGTLLLENVNAIASAFHPRLQEILDTREVHRLGDRWNATPLDVRVIATSSRAEDLVCPTGGFRRALYDRLSVISFEMPSLRSRRDDLQPLLEHFGRVATGGREIDFDAATRLLLARYPWPGNLRELQNAVECGVVLGDGERIRVEDLPVAIQKFDDPAAARVGPQRAIERVEPSRECAETIERRCILEAMKKTAADRAAVARLLGMTRRTLAYRIAMYDLEDELAALESAALGPKPRGIRQLARVRPVAEHLFASGL